MAKNIEAQLTEYVEKLHLSRLSSYFQTFKSTWVNDDSSELRFALSQGFYMNTCRKVSHMQKKDGQVYLSVADGSFVKSDRDSSTYAGADYVIYTQL
jgi:hypothetical protein